MNTKVGLVSLGCAKNLVDSENLLGMLAQRGMEIVADPAEADVIFVNTCGFIESAKEESIETIFEMAQYKHGGKLKKLFVTGCLAQRYPDALLSEIPEIDGIMGVADYARLDSMLADADKKLRPCYIADGPRFLHTPRILTNAGYSAYVKISDGCDNKCTYCAIPLIRGAYASRPFDDIVDECRRLAADGVTEITLIAQDTSRYGCDFGDGHYQLPELLEAIHEIEGIHWLRVLYCYPDSTDDRLLDTIARLPKVAPYLDLPLQHIDDDMLRRMNRRGSSDWIKSRLAECRKRGILLRTTMIVGFPGETEEQFETLLNFVKEARFDRLGAFTYSPEEGTPGAAMPDQIDEDTKLLRLDQLMMLQQSVSMEINEARIGTTCEVLVDGFDEGRPYGRSLLEAPESDGCIWLNTTADLTPGTYVTVRITDADAYDLYGEVVAAEGE
ncbi:MAG: 30S ribosomal protein S12 methylthiotransferase RimO [Clostridia bacterium]|nr:30S ribosomal protein S12 methylthiotransferase RimO [Clostridia bacterium]